MNALVAWAEANIALLAGTAITSTEAWWAIAEETMIEIEGREGLEKHVLELESLMEEERR